MKSALGAGTVTQQKTVRKLTEFFHPIKVLLDINYKVIKLNGREKAIDFIWMGFFTGCVIKGKDCVFNLAMKNEQLCSLLLFYIVLCL